MEFFSRYGYNPANLNSPDKAAMVVLDAHADTAINEGIGMMREFAGSNIFLDALRIGNHNWIYPISPCLGTLAWIGTLRGSLRSDKLEGFLKSTTAWNVPIRTVFLAVEELRFFEISGKVLFISVDLDFFYSDDNGPDDIHSVLDILFSFSSCWPGQVVWAVCLSRPWLPNDHYAWTLLEKTLCWMRSRPEFSAPEITLFNSSIVDTSKAAQAYRSEGREPPHLREEDAPEHITALLRELKNRE